MRSRLWERIGDSPIKTATRLLLRHQSESRNVKIVDVGCGGGHDLVLLEALLAPTFGGKLRLIGFDASPAMISECRRREVEAHLGDFRDYRKEIAGASLLWSNFGLIHMPSDEFEDALRFLAECTKSNGIIAISFKTGDGSFRVDPAGKAIAVERPTAYHRIDYVKQSLEDLECNVVASIHIPAETDTSNDYCWLFALKKP
jgi:SAM-dependent methyltransferase